MLTHTRANSALELSTGSIRTTATLSALALGVATMLVSTGTPARADEATLLSQGQPAAASSTEAGYTAARFAVDGDLTTRWASQLSDVEWLRVDLGAQADISHVDLTWEGAYGRAYEIQVSDDGQTWSTAASVTNGTGGTESINVDGSGRYIQLLTSERGTAYGYSLWEFEVYGTGGLRAPAIEPPPFDDEVTHREFQANCTVSHFNYDDPIVFPGQVGASHLHTFMGNTSTNAFTQISDLFANRDTTCTNPKDNSAYWFPAIQKGDDVIVPDIHQTIYYKSGIEDYWKVQSFPEGIRFVVGDMMATPESFQNAPGAVEGWECGELSFQWDIPGHCDPGTQLNIRYQAPSCWDGVNLDSPNHKSHMAYPVHGECPLSHPVPVPMLEFKIAWPVSGDMSDVHLVSGSDQSWHYDFMNGWDPEILDALVMHCINGGLQCNPQGYDLYKPHRGAAITANFDLQ
jgi:hypothetical protein